MIASIPGNEWMQGLTWQRDPDGFDVPHGRPLTNQAVVIWGGGPGFTSPMAKALSPYPAILVNNSYRRMNRSSILVSLDQRWWGWHAQSVQSRGDMMVTGLLDPRSGPGLPGLRRMRKERNHAFTEDRSVLCGNNSGHAAIILAMHLGARDIFLAGFDMDFPNEISHWHEGHLVPSSIENYEKLFKPMLVSLVYTAKERNVHITAITRTSAPIPRFEMDVALAILKGQHARRMDHTSA